MIEAYLIHLLILIGIYFILAISLQVSLGFTGLLNLGHVAFYAIGAYTSALLILNGFPFWFSFLMAGVLAMIAGLILALPIRKLKGDYLALATMGFTYVVYAIIINWSELTNGPLGLPNINKPSLFGFSFASNLSFLILVVIITAITSFIVYKIVKSPFGKVLESIRDDELASQSLGKNTFKMKSFALAISAFFAGIAGSLYAHYVTYIDPTSFTIVQLIPVLAIIIIGGLASLKGTLAATVILVLIPELLRFIGLSSSIVGPARQIIYALILLLIMLYKPKGLYGKVELD
jgi:branched-chain amino acid transport system permease protein